ncbi:peptidase M23 [Enterococcus florum]|uniref:Peptidase M23 n=1 Tax=Enterococcus florum TaxID=2480627 RepID=A0A4V0WPA3_9ENTE|nr:LysM domain-containing protein [Enterococcus florum]GCF93159.1 peptidase M23 [Enterococcus florum]
MKLGKTFLFSSLLAAGTGLAFGATDAHAAEKYTVEAGDTLSKISHKFVGDNSLIKVIAKDNNIEDIDKIYAGQELTIDKEGKVEAAPVQEAAPVEQVQPAPAAPVEEVAPKAAETAPVEQAAPVQEAAPVAEQPAQPVQQAPAAEQPAAPAYQAPVGSSAKEWIAQKESGGSYSATNGQYIGRYQLSAAYLNGDYSPENQERVADQYVSSRYGSWEAAQSFWLSNGWY